LSLLGHSAQSFPPIQFVARPPLGVSRLAAGYTIHDGADTHIVLVTSTAAFLDARQASTPCSDAQAIREIAGVLAHEEWHVRHGVDEGGAYDAQLITLLRIGEPFDGALIHKVKKTKEAVLAAARRAEKATAVAGGNTSSGLDSTTMMSVPSRGGP
jgi:hypothetical protein